MEYNIGTVVVPNNLPYTRLVRLSEDEQMLCDKEVYDLKTLSL